MTSEEPRVLGGRYEVGELIGRGGMAEVHAGHDLRLGRQVAIKILRTDLARDTSFLARFRREAQSAAALNHPAIVAVYDSGESESTESGGAPVLVPYIIMEHVEGRTLRQILNDEKVLDPDEAARVAAAVLGALEYSHERGIVHRDIKPANVMVTRGGAVKVMDFGIARALADTAATMTQTQAVLGTARYLSPEQAQGLDVDTRSDLYSAGCLFYELLTGRTPFVGDPVALVYQHLGEPPKPPSQYQHDLPAAMDAIALHALEKSPDGRYQTAGEFRDDLNAARAGKPISEAAQASLQRAIGPAAAAALHGGDSTELIAAGAPPPEQVAWGRDPDDAPGGGAGAVGLADDYDDFEDTDELPVREERHRGGWIIVGVLGVLALAAVIWIVLATTGGGDDDPPPTQTPATVTVPDVLGETEADAIEVIEAENLVADPQPATEDQAAAVTDATPGDVIAQSPEGGQPAQEQSTVTIYIFGGPETEAIPDLRDQSEEDARDTLAELGFEVAATAEVIDALTAEDEELNALEVTPGNVVRTDPAVGETATPGEDEVTLYLAGDTIPVPTLAGQEESEALETLAAVHIGEDRIDVLEEPSPDPDVEAGTVIRTSPGPGRDFNRSEDTLTVYVASGDVEVPVVSGLTVDDAARELVDRGFVVDERIEEVNSDDVDPGRVVRTSPDAGQEVARGTTIILYIARATIPDLTGSTVGDATDELESLGFQVASDVVEEDDLDVDAGRVTRTTPAAGQRPDRGTEITLYVARSTVALPDLGGLTESEARQALQDADLEVGDVTEEDSSDTEPGQVLRAEQDGDQVNTGDTVERGSSIDLILAREPDNDD